MGESIVETTKDAVVTALADGAQGSDVQKVLVSVYEQVKASGDFQTVMNSIKAKITSRFLQALEELLGAAIDKIEAFIKEKLEELLPGQVPRYIDLGIQKLETVPGGQFVANITESLMETVCLMRIFVI